MQGKKNTKRRPRPRKPDGSIDWKEYDKQLMERWKEDVDIKIIKKKKGILIRLTRK
jgi:hypothetical protein